MTNILTAFLKRPSSRDRRFKRYAIEMRAELYFTERRYGIAGMLIELSQGGALFREASQFILDRKRAEVALRVGQHEMRGTIVNVRPAGYGILFESPLSEDTIAELASTHQDAAS